MSLEELSAALVAARAKDITGTEIAFGELTVTVRLEALIDFIGWLRIDPGC